MFRFFIRDMLWLTLVVTLTLSWRSEWSKANKLEWQYRDLRSNVESCPPGMRVVIDDQGSSRVESNLRSAAVQARNDNGTVNR